MHAFTKHTREEEAGALAQRKERVKEPHSRLGKGLGVVPGTFSCLGEKNETLPGQAQTQPWRRQIPSRLIPEPTLSLPLIKHPRHSTLYPTLGKSGNTTRRVISLEEVDITPPTHGSRTHPNLCFSPSLAPPGFASTGRSIFWDVLTNSPRSRYTLASGNCVLGPYSLLTKLPSP